VCEEFLIFFLHPVILPLQLLHLVGDSQILNSLSMFFKSS
jgi:hypothetical protein